MKSKIKTQDELREVIDDLHMAGKKVVFTNGCFDLIHTGHVRYLKIARGYGDALVVAVNSDGSVNRLKGEKRPIMPQDERIEVLAALSMVDFVTVFEEDDPHRIIAELMPDVLVKGGDWDVERIVGKDLVIQGGGKVYSIPYIEGSSTTTIIDRVIDRYCR